MAQKCDFGVYHNDLQKMFWPAPSHFIRIIFAFSSLKHRGSLPTMCNFRYSLHFDYLPHYEWDLVAMYQTNAGTGREDDLPPSSFSVAKSYFVCLWEQWWDGKRNSMKLPPDWIMHASICWQRTSLSGLFSVTTHTQTHTHSCTHTHRFMQSSLCSCSSLDCWVHTKQYPSAAVESDFIRMAPNHKWSNGTLNAGKIDLKKPCLAENVFLGWVRHEALIRETLVCVPYVTNVLYFHFFLSSPSQF